VLATPRLVALCEKATVAAVAAHLAEGETTVGTRVELDHLAPSGEGAGVTAVAVLEDVDGRRLTFAVEAAEGARIVARGRVRRVIVDRERFLNGA
jgi:predicted thioesterase